VMLDDRVDTPFGRRAVDAELKGYPVRVEVGPRDLAAGNVTLVTRVDGAKRPVPLEQAVEAATVALREAQDTLLSQARARREERTADVSTVDDAIAASADGWGRLPWDAVGVDGENAANAQGVTVRCLTREDGSVPDSEDEPGLIAYLARAY
jgi:prolyl-tRNA synthetase